MHLLQKVSVSAGISIAVHVPSSFSGRAGPWAGIVVELLQHCTESTLRLGGGPATELKHLAVKLHGGNLLGKERLHKQLRILLNLLDPWDAASAALLDSVELFAQGESGNELLRLPILAAVQQTKEGKSVLAFAQDVAARRKDEAEVLGQLSAFERAWAAAPDAWRFLDVHQVEEAARLVQQAVELREKVKSYKSLKGTYEGLATQVEDRPGVPALACLLYWSGLWPGLH